MDILARPGLKLPLEILQLIIESLVLGNPGTILPPSDETTKALLAWTRVCRATHQIASTLLWRHCSYIDSPERLDDYYHALMHLSPDDARRPTNLFLGLYCELRYPDAHSVSLDAWPCWSRGLALPGGQTDDEIVWAVGNLLRDLASTLRRLVIEMPLEQLKCREDIEEDAREDMLYSLRHAFAALVHLEEFVSCNDHFSFSTRREVGETEVWATCWPKLRRLALHSPELSASSEIWGQMVRLPRLELVVFSCDDSFDVFTGADIKQELLHALDANNAATGGVQVQGGRRKIHLVVVDCFCYGYQDPHPNDDRARVDLLDVTRTLDTAQICTGIRTGDRPSNVTLSWLKQNALNGTLWDAASQNLVD